MLAAIVRQAGFAVETARDGQEAIDKLQDDGAYNCVLLDLMMPHVNGYDVLQHISLTQPDLLRRTIVATAVPEREVLRDLKHPVFRIHYKPFELPRLIADLRLCAKS